MKNLAKIVLLLLISTSCTKRIMLNGLNFDSNAYPMFGKNPQRTFYHNINLGDSLKLKWETGTKGSYKNTSPIFLDDYMFTSDLAGRVYAFDLQLGKVLGEEKNKGAVSIAPVIYNSKIVYVVEELNEAFSTVYFYDYYNGDYIKEHMIEGSVGNEMLKIEDAVLMISENGLLYNFSLSGKIKWKLDTESTVRCSPAQIDDIFIFGNVNGEIVAVSISKEEIIYRNKISERIQSGITIDNGLGYVGDDAGFIYCFDVENGDIIWRFNTDAKIVSIAVMNDKNLFIGNLSGELFSLDKNNGEINWISETGGIINTTPILFNDYLVQPDLFKKIHFVDVGSGEITKQITTDGRMKMSPVYFNGVIYFGMDRGEIIAYEVFSEEE